MLSHHYHLGNIFSALFHFFFDPWITLSVLFPNIWGNIHFRDISVTDFKFNFIVVREDTLYELNSFECIESCFMA